MLLILDEATNANLVGAAGHEVRALAECQKMGLDIHVLVQSLNFPSSYVTDDDLRQGPKQFADPQAWAERLVELALERGSKDNVTCIVVAFDPE